ncbi:MAG: thioredoxin domain-containing protein [Candidatus Gracilibacteria bacterium]|nr:thioredoxin domain-containing protein [Candidatus Gracilibacteria bacterium]MDD2909045.1 thioredoxin domain-containing protein [Candidatus Gracilibacteria bacterium]
MFKKVLTLIFASFILLSCTAERDIFNEETAKSFKNQNIESPFFGNPNSKVQLMIFSDFQCPACINFEKTIGNKLLTEYALTNKIGLTYKNFPLNIHVNAPEDALASMCAHEQNKYNDFAVKMYALEEQKNGLRLSTEDRQGVAKAAGLDVAKFNQCVLEGRYVDKVKQDMAEGEKMGLQGTPSVYANGKLIGFNSSESFYTILDGLLK